MLLLKLKKYLIIAGAVITAALAVWLKGRTSGRKAAEQDQLVDAAEAQRETVQVRNKVDDEIGQMAAGGSDRKLRDEWMRDE